VSRWAMSREAPEVCLRPRGPAEHAPVFDWRAGPVLRGARAFGFGARLIRPRMSAQCLIGGAMSGKSHVIRLIVPLRRP